MTSQELVYKPPAPAASAETVTPVEGARPSGPAAAVVLSAALGCLTLGVLSVLTAAKDGVSDALTVSERVGDISGITTASAAVFFASWAVLAVAWRRADPPLARVAAAAGLLIALGLLGTFPPFFNLFD
ncbi:MAG: hypothetical protein ACJ75P_13290 [Gaiellaceae bacterium]